MSKGELKGVKGSQRELSGVKRNKEESSGLILIYFDLVLHIIILPSSAKPQHPKECTKVNVPKDKIMHSFDHKTVNFSQSKPYNQKTS